MTMTVGSLHKTCEQCGSGFSTDLPNKRFCSKRCKTRARSIRANARKPKKYPDGFRNSPEWRAKVAASKRKWAEDTLQQRFWSKVNKTDGCWLWIGNRDVYGYGVFRIDGKCWKAHRAALLFTNGTIDKSLGVLHSCDNPACVNPAHLRQGNQKENTRDAYEHGKFSKMTPDQLHALAVRRANIRWGNEVAQ